MAAFYPTSGHTGGEWFDIAAGIILLKKWQNSYKLIIP